MSAITMNDCSYKIWLYAGISAHMSVPKGDNHSSMISFMKMNGRADNQQGRFTKVKTLRDYTPDSTPLIGNKRDDIVRPLWRHRELHAATVSRVD